jgi:hypothetical protein
MIAEGVIVLLRSRYQERSRREGTGGVYETCDNLVGSAVDDLLLRLRAVPPVAVASYKDGLLVVGAARRACVRAGYSFDR